MPVQLGQNKENDVLGGFVHYIFCALIFKEFFIFLIFNCDIYLSGSELWVYIVLQKFTSLNSNFQMCVDKKGILLELKILESKNITYLNPSSGHYILISNNFLIRRRISSLPGTTIDN